MAAWEILRRSLRDSGLEEQVEAKKRDCFRICREGPIAFVQPDGVWYGGCTPEVITRIAREHLHGDRPVAEYLLEDPYVLPEG